jgi:alpha-L-fucosidase
MHKMHGVVVLMLAWAIAAAVAEDASGKRSSVEAETSAEHDERMAWWRQARFGMFVHWGLYAIPAGEWNGETRHAEWIRHTARIPVTEYEKLASQFNPVRFDANAWARLAKEAGMRYIVITSKHHDGFCLFDSAQTDFDIMATPYRRDIMRALAEACRRHDLRIGWYHSIMDWHHPDYLPRRAWERERRPVGDADYEKFMAYLKAQVRELLTNYGRIDVMWFDGEWEDTWTHARGVALCRHVRALQPQIIVNNRVDVGRAGMAGLTKGSGYVGDFGTPEQEIPPRGLPGVDWETCMTMNDHWGYNKHDDNWKSTAALLRTLVDVASKGGNLLLNVGPTAEGTIPEPSVVRLREMGRWLSVHGEAIYGTEASPFPDALPWGRCTQRVGHGPDGLRTTLYLHVFDWPEDGRLVVSGLDNRVLGARLLAGGRALGVAPRVGGLAVAVPQEAPHAVVSVVALEVSGEPEIIQPPEIVTASEIFVSQAAVEIRPRCSNADTRYTTDGSDPSVATPARPLRFQVDRTTEIRAQHFRAGKPLTAISRRMVRRVEPRAAEDAERVRQGLRFEYFEGEWDQLPGFEALTPAARGVVKELTLSPRHRVERFGFRYRGKLVVPRTGIYEFATVSDDGSRLLIGDHVVVDNDGLHGMREARGRLALAAGAHSITIEFFEKTGGDGLEVWYAGPGIEWQRLSGGATFCE